MSFTGDKKDLVQADSPLNRSTSRSTDHLCPVCGYWLHRSPLPVDGSYDVSAIVNDYPGGPGYIVHGQCLGGQSQMNYARWLRMKLWQQHIRNDDRTDESKRAEVA